jgi:DNA-binding LacI/PurR family transcriptional regulator
MMDAAQALIESKVDGVLYYPAELPGDLMKLNREVVDLLVAAGIEIVLIDRDIVRIQIAVSHRVGCNIAAAADGPSDQGWLQANAFIDP